MTYVVTEQCINCKYTNCAGVCPTDAFREGRNFLAIDPDDCIDCRLCVAECPVNAIFAEEDLPADQGVFLGAKHRVVRKLESHCEPQKAIARCRLLGNGTRQAAFTAALVY